MEIKIIILGSAYLISALLKIDLHYFSQRCKKPFMDEYSMHRLEGSQISLMSDKRLLVAKIIELTFGHNDLMTFSDFRTHGRLLCDLIFTLLILNLPCSNYFNTVKLDLENLQKEAASQ